MIDEGVKEVVKSNNSELLQNISGMINKISAKPVSTVSLLDFSMFNRKINAE